MTSGPGCRRVLAALSSSLRGGLTRPTAADATTPISATASTGQFVGSALWKARVLRGAVLSHGREGGPSGRSGASGSSGSSGSSGASGSGPKRPAWQEAVEQQRVVPSAETILATAQKWYGCARSDNDPCVCADLMCPTCWEGGRNSLQKGAIACSRFKHGVPPKVSSGLGRLKGGDVKAATTTGGTPRAWACGRNSGESCEAFTSREARKEDRNGDGDVTLVKILYFFDIEANRRPDSTSARGPVMEFALGYEYVTCGKNRSKKEDPATKHPTYYLQGGASVVPSVFPVAAIRRHVHMHHLCPVASFEAGPASTSRSAGRPMCGLQNDTDGTSGGKVWRHHYNLASSVQSKSNQAGRDAYMLNEHWHSAFQDGVV